MLSIKIPAPHQQDQINKKLRFKVLTVMTTNAVVF